MYSLERLLHIAEEHGQPLVIVDPFFEREFLLTPLDTSNGESLYDEYCEDTIDSCDYKSGCCDLDTDMFMEDFDSEDALLDAWYEAERRSFLDDPTGEVLLEQINQDICLWRERRIEERISERADVLEEELTETPLVDPFAEDFTHEPEWHTAGSVLAAHTQHHLEEQSEQEISTKEDILPQKRAFVSFTGMVADIPKQDELSWDEPIVGTDSEWSDYQPMEVTQVKGSEPLPISSVTIIPEDIGEEEALPDDETPIFYEEPQS